MSTAPIPKPVLVEKPAVEIEFNSWPRVTPGVYEAYSRRASIYWDKHFKRWVCLVRFSVMGPEQKELGIFPWYLNLGSDKAKPKAGSRGNFYSAWMAANGGRRPERQDRMTADVFKHRMATVEIADTGKNHLQQSVSEGSCYSVVRQVKSWNTGSISQVVKQSRKPAGKAMQQEPLTRKPWQTQKEIRAQFPETQSLEERVAFLEAQKRQILERERLQSLSEAGQSATQSK